MESRDVILRGLCSEKNIYKYVLTWSLGLCLDKFCVKKNDSDIGTYVYSKCLCMCVCNTSKKVAIQGGRGGGSRGVVRSARPPLGERRGGGAPPCARPQSDKLLKSGLKTRLERLKNRKFSYPQEGDTL